MSLGARSVTLVADGDRGATRTLEDGSLRRAHADAGDVMVAAEVAKLLRMNVKTVYDLAKAGELPSWRLGRHFRFSRTTIMAHLGQCKAAPYRRGK